MSIDKILINVNFGKQKVYIASNNIIKGIYAHPKLVPHIISWLSYENAMLISNIVNNC